MARDEETPRPLDELLTSSGPEGASVDELVAAFKQIGREADRQEAELRTTRQQQAKLIAKLNREFNLSFDRIAQLLGLSRATVNRWALRVPPAE